MEQKLEYDYHFKIILLGDNCVGKSSLLHTYLGDDFDLYDYYDTLSVDQKIKSVRAFNKKIKLHIWDASGTPKLRDIAATYVRLIDGALVCFDVTSTASFHNAKALIQSIRASKKQSPIILVGCKSDLVQLRVVSNEQAKHLADDLGLTYLEVSALKKINIKEPFEQITQHIYCAARLNKIKVALVELYCTYLKAEVRKNRTALFTKNGLKEDALKKEYKHNLEHLLKSTSRSEWVVFYKKTVDISERAENLLTEELSCWGLFSKSSLINVLQKTLNVLRTIPSELIPISHLKGLIVPNKILPSTMKF